MPKGPESFSVVDYLAPEVQHITDLQCNPCTWSVWVHLMQHAMQQVMPRQQCRVKAAWYRCFSIEARVITPPTNVPATYASLPLLQILKHSTSSSASSSTAAGDTSPQLFSFGDEYTSGSITGAKVPPFRKPAQHDKSGYDQKVDIWAVGCLLFELLTGVRRCFPAWHSPADLSSCLMNDNMVTLYDNLHI